jgi:hypothetical protein
MDIGGTLKDFTRPLAFHRLPTGRQYVAIGLTFRRCVAKFCSAAADNSDKRHMPHLHWLFPPSTARMADFM